MPEQTIQPEDDGVLVKIRSKRGTGTRDEDVVVVEARYPTVEQAQSDSQELNELVEARMADARAVDDSGCQRAADTGPISDNAEPASNNGDHATDRQPSPSGADDRATTNSPKIYFGDGSNLSGWIPVPRQVVFNEIAPVVKQHTVDDETEGINLNFTSDVPLSGWKNVDPAVVVDQLEPVVRRHRTDRETPSGDDNDSLVRCPAESCGYTGTINQLIGHLGGTNDSDHAELAVIECPVDGCSYTGGVGSIGGHINAVQDDDHEPRLLVETDPFEVVE